MNRHIIDFLNDESGATAVEYGMLVGLFALGILSWASIMTDWLDTTFTEVKGALNDTGAEDVSG